MSSQLPKLNTIKRRLYRDREHRIIAGICGGLGRFFKIDPTWVRIIFIILLLAAGATLWIYLILWLVIPLEPEN